MPIKTLFSRRRLVHAIGKPEKTRLGRRRSQAHLTSRLVIRKPPSWSRRILLGLGLALLVAAAGYGLYAAGQLSAGHDRFQAGARIDQLRTVNADQRQRVMQLDAALKRATTELMVAQGARQALETQVRRLETELSQVNEDIALFENLFPAMGADEQPAIRGFHIAPIAASGTPTAWRYRVLVIRNGQPKTAFSGEFQLQVRYRLAGREILAQNAATGHIAKPLAFQRYQRLDGQFQAPAGATLLGALARVMENGRSVTEYVYHP